MSENKKCECYLVCKCNIWQLVYGNSEDGTRTDGDKTVLQNAVKTGADIKVLVETGQRTRIFSNPSEVVIKGQEIVFSVDVVENSSGTDGKPELIFKQGTTMPFRAYMILSTNGHWHVSKLTFDNDWVRDHDDPLNNTTAKMKWYANSGY